LKMLMKVVRIVHHLLLLLFLFEFVVFKRMIPQFKNSVSKQIIQPIHWK
jgi:hypothetical protein